VKTLASLFQAPHRIVLWVVAALTVLLTAATAYGIVKAGLFARVPTAGIAAVLVPAFVTLLLGRLMSAPRAKGLLIVVSLMIAVWVIGAGGVLGVTLMLLASLAIGEWVMRLDRARSGSASPDLLSTSLALSAGLAVLGLAYTVLAHLPITNPASVTFTLIAIIVLGRKAILRFAAAFHAWLISEVPTQLWTWFAAGLLLAATLINVGYAALPSFSGDTIAMHQYISSYMQAYGKWNFDVTIYSFAVMPMLGDLLFVPSYLLGDVAGGQLMNAVIATLVALLLFGTVRARVGAFNAMLCATAWLLIPLVLLESADLHVESVQTLFMFAPFVYLSSLDTTAPANPHGVGAISGLLVGASIATKLPAFILCPFLLLFVLVVFGRRHGLKWAARAAVTAVLVVITIGSFQYWYSLHVTGSPVFYFYNAIFLSPYSDAINFVDGNFLHRLNWDLPLGLIFNTGHYGELGPGGLGFQWAVLLVPAAILAAFAGGAKARWAGLFGFGFLIFVLLPEQYMRYTLPAFPFLSILVSEAAASPYLLNQIVFRGAMLITILYNAMGMNGVNFHFDDLPLKPMFRMEARADLEQRMQPAEALNRVVDSLQSEPSRVLYFAKRDGGGLQGLAYYQEWYRPEIDKYSNGGHITPEAIEALIAADKIDYIEIDTTSKRWTTPEIMDFCNHHAQRVANVRGMVLYRVGEEGLYSQPAVKNAMLGGGARFWILDGMQKPVQFRGPRGLMMRSKDEIRQDLNVGSYSEGEKFVDLEEQLQPVERRHLQL
jgi:hypothetical protein